MRNAVKDKLARGELMASMAVRLVPGVEIVRTAGRLHATLRRGDVRPRAGRGQGGGLRPAQRLHRREPRLPHTAGAGGQLPPSCEELAGARRAGQGEARGHHLRQLGQRLHRPCGGGALHARERRKAHAGELQGQRAGAHRRHGRPAARPRSHFQRALSGASRSAKPARARLHRHRRRDLGTALSRPPRRLAPW